MRNRLFTFVLTLTLLFAFARPARAADVTVSGFSINGWNYAGTTFYLRIAADSSFVTLAGETIPQGTLGTSAQDVYRTVTCTANTTTHVLTCPAFTLPSTTDAQVNAQATWSGSIYSSTGAKLKTLFSGYFLSASLASNASLAEWTVNVQSGDLVNPPRTYYTASEVDTQIRNQVNVGNPATTNTLGRVRLHSAPTDPAAPETVVTEDARLSDARTPTDGSVTDAKIVAGGLSPSSVAGTAVITTDPRLSGQIATSTTAGLPTAGTQGRLRKLTDGAQDVVIDTGSDWHSLTGQVYNVKLLGAKGDSSTTDTTAIQLAITRAGNNGGGTVYFPASSGCYKTGPLTVSSNNVRLVGAGWASRLCMKDATGDTLSFDNGVTGNVNLEDTTMLTGSGVENLRLEPLGNRTSGAEVKAYRYNKIYLNDLVIQATPGSGNLLYMGMLLGRAADNQAITAYVNNLRMRQYKFGVKAVNAIEVWGSNWSLDKFDYTNNTYSIWLSGGTAGFSLVNFDVVNSLYSTVGPTANNVYSLYVHNDAGSGTALANFFTNGNLDSHTRGLYADYGVGFHFTNVEFSALSTGSNTSTGVTLTGTSSSDTVDDYVFDNCQFINSGGPGIYVGGYGRVAIIGGEAAGNNKQGFASSNFLSSGIVIDGGNVRVIGVRSGNSALFASNFQQYGVWTSATVGLQYTIIGNDLTDNTAGAVNNLGGFSTVRKFSNNLGYITQASGSATVTSGNTSVAVTHGLSLAPGLDDIMITPNNLSTNNVRCYVSATSTTTFTVTCSGDPGASGYVFGWSAEIK